MMAVNYQKELDQLLARLQEEKQVPSLLLHSCCAPCSSYVLEYLSAYADQRDGDKASGVVSCRVL